MTGGVALSSSSQTLSGAYSYVYGPLPGGFSVTNLGTVAATGNAVPAAIYLKLGGSVTNGQSAAVTGHGTDAGVAIVGAPGTVTNFGSIAGGVSGRGIALYDGGTVINGSAADTLAAISASGTYAAVFIDGTTAGIPGSPTNPGTGGGGSGIVVAAGMMTSGIGSNGIGGGTGVQIASSAAPITNFGIIRGGIGIEFNYAATAGTVINAGTIASTAGTAGDAILFRQSDARVVVDPGAVFIGHVVAAGGGSNVLELAAGKSTGTLSGLGTNLTGFDTTVDAGAQWKLAGANSIAAGATITVAGFLTNTGSLSGAGMVVLDGGTAALGSGLAASIGIDMAGAGADTLILPGGGAYGTMANAITGFSYGDRIEMPGIPFNSAVLDGTALQLAIGGLPIFTLENISFAGVEDPHFRFGLDPSNIDVFVELACFAAGTRILTAAGEVAVEAVRVGMLVPSLAHRRLLRVVWVGHRRVNCATHPRPQQVWPVRIAAHAFGPDRPHRELFVSPDHAVGLPDGRGGMVLIPARYLVNGATIVQEFRDRICYYHIELESHGVVVAEGLGAESYLDTGNRAAFANGGSRRSVDRGLECAPGHWGALAPDCTRGRSIQAT